MYSKGSVVFGKRVQARRLKSSEKWNLMQNLWLRNHALYRITYRNHLKIGLIRE